MDANVYDMFPSGQDSISSVDHTKYKQYFRKLASEAYAKIMADIDESVHDITSQKRELSDIRPCPSDKESEIFSSQSDMEEDSCLIKCPSFQFMDLLGEKDLPNDWHGYFRGFKLCRLDLDFEIEENRKCMELTLMDKNLDIETYLRKGIRCFMLDLFVGTEMENLGLINKVREAEIRLTREYGFPITSTIIAKMSPRHQYIGLFDPEDSVYELNTKDTIVLSVDRYWSTRGSAKQVYVNARNLIDTLQVCDVLAVGPSLQLTVRAIDETNIYCVVSRPGEIRSHMCILFPQKCLRYRISWEEVESITFANAVGMNVLASYIEGTPAYMENLKNVFKLLEAGHMRFFARVVINEVKGCDYDMDWVVSGYDGFIIDFKPKTNNNRPENLHLCPNAVCLLEDMFRKNKPMLFESYQILRRKLTVLPENYIHVFLYPDKYIDKTNSGMTFDYFNLLAQRYLKDYNFAILSKHPYCDLSYTGIDTLARATVAASFEIPAKAIIITSQLGLIAEKIASFRPMIPIILVSRTKALIEYVMLYHNVILLYIPTEEKQSYKKLVFKEMMVGIKFLRKIKIINENDYMLLVYGMRRGTKFQDKYAKIQYNEKTYVRDLRKELFAQ